MISRNLKYFALVLTLLAGLIIVIMYRRREPVVLSSPTLLLGQQRLKPIVVERAAVDVDKLPKIKTTLTQAAASEAVLKSSSSSSSFPNIFDASAPTHACDDAGASTSDILAQLLLEMWMHTGLRLVLTETFDLVVDGDEGDFVADSFLNPDVAVTRIGVFEENFALLDSTLTSFLSKCGGGGGRKKITRKDIKSVDPRLEKRKGNISGAEWRKDLRCGTTFPIDGKPAKCNPLGEYPCCSNAGGSGWCGHTPDHCKCGTCVDYTGHSGAAQQITTHIFIVIPAKEDSSLPPLKAPLMRPNQFFNWKRIHFRVMFKRGVDSQRDQPGAYRWIAEEPDDIGEPKLRAESYEAFSTRPLKVVVDNVNATIAAAAAAIFHVPRDKKFFLWEKEGAEFKECPVHSSSIRRKFENNWRGKKVTDESTIRKYMTGIMAVKRLMHKHGVFSWMNCGTLLGWYRQCSLIPKDPDIDMLHYSNPDLYPKIDADIRRDNRFKIISSNVNEDTPGGYQRGFYWKLGVKSGINVDTYMYFSHKLYDMNHKKGDIKYFDFTDQICSADLHGYRVYVLCNKSYDLSRVYYGPDIFTPR